MGIFFHKHNSSYSSKKLVLLISIAGLLGAAFIADFIWTSSSSSYLSISSNWALEKNGVIDVSNEDTNRTSRVSPLDPIIYIVETQYWFLLYLYLYFYFLCALYNG